jgi:hypothetical protein
MHSRFPGLFPPSTDVFSAQAAKQLALLPTLVCRALHTASQAELLSLWPTDTTPALLHSISTRPDSMWLDAVP